MKFTIPIEIEYEFGEDTTSDTVAIKWWIKCPYCGQLFFSLEEYFTHLRKIHKVSW